MTHYDDPDLVRLVTTVLTSMTADSSSRPSEKDIASAVLDAVVPCIAKKVVCEIADTELPPGMSMQEFLRLQAQALDLHTEQTANVS